MLDQMAESVPKSEAGCHYSKIMLDILTDKLKTDVSCGKRQKREYGKYIMKTAKKKKINKKK